MLIKTCTMTCKKCAIPSLHPRCSLRSRGARRDSFLAKVPGLCPVLASGNTTSPYCQAVSGHLRMKVIISILLVVSSCSLGYGQIIKGTVMDKNTHDGIMYALVYFDGTFVSTYANQNGYFQLDISKNFSMPLTISAIGYYSDTINNPSTDKLNIIYLAPKTYKLNEVVITAIGNSITRKTNLGIFKKEFLGETMNAKKCNITNEDDIMLNNYTHSYKFRISNGNSLIVNIDTLKAFCSNPIKIVNKALGYNLTYYLDKFEYCSLYKYLLIIGNCIFKVDSIYNKRQQKRFEERRKSAYLGSRMHFIRTLWENNLDSVGFTVKTSNNNRIPYDRLAAQSDILAGSYYLKYINYHGLISIAYYSKSPNSHIMIEKDKVYFNKNCILNPLDVSWSGEMARQRIGDLLPFEYEVSSK